VIKFKDRLAQLQREHDAGTRALSDLDARRSSLAETLLRIEGAASLLRELIAEDAKPRVDSKGGQQLSTEHAPAA
jgi:hypothetical protein